jgi:DUF4097 and DUF4098 domain-containing protein YvlB
MEQSFPTPDPIRLELKVPAGAIEIDAGGSGETAVRLEGPDELVERATVELRGDELRVDVPERKGLFISFGRGDEVRLTVRCPEGSSLHARTKSADVAVRGRLVAARAETASGDVSLDRVETASVKSASGDIRVNEALGELAVQTASGDVQIERTGQLSANLVSGDLHVRDATGPVSARTVSGDAQLEAVVAGDVSVQAVSGDVRVGVRRGSLVHVDASTLSGDTHSELDLGDAPTTQEDGPLVDLRIKTVSGDIAVVRASAPTPQEV